VSIRNDHIFVKPRASDFFPRHIRLEIRDLVAQLIREKELTSMRNVSAHILAVLDAAANVHLQVYVSVAAGVPARIDRLELDFPALV
jgi:hypothetical protein